MDGKSIFELIESEKGHLRRRRAHRLADDAGPHAGQRQLRFSTLKRTVIGGSACPPAMITAFNDDYGVEVLHAWGMTEMSPLGTLCTLKNKHLDLPAADKMKVRLKQGRAIYGVDMKIVDDGRQGAALGRQDVIGDLLVKGPWIIKDYFKGEGGDAAGARRAGTAGSPPATWPPSTPTAYMQITDRSKDVIKSGGEWISSIDIENIAVAHPAVAMAACIGVAPSEVGRAAHRGGGEEARCAELTRDELLANSTPARQPSGRFPTTSYSSRPFRSARPGKILKTRLREQLQATTSCQTA